MSEAVRGGETGGACETRGVGDTGGASIPGEATNIGEVNRAVRGSETGGASDTEEAMNLDKTRQAN